MNDEISTEIRDIILTLWDKSVLTETYKKELWLRLVYLLELKGIAI